MEVLGLTKHSSYGIVCISHISIPAISRADYITMIENALKNKSGNNNFTYTKGNRDIYSLLQKYGDENMAKKHAEKLRKSFNNTNYATHNPCTMVDKLVDELRHPERFL